MATIRLRRGKESDRDKVVPRQGEPLFTTDTKRLYIGDGVSAGGVPVGTGEPGKGVPAGGTTGQVLAKKSNVAYDTEWVDQEAGGVESVNNQTGVVVLDPDDLDDTATTHKFTTADDIAKLAGIENGADVTDADNVAAAGATMNTDTSLAGNGYFLDEDDMASNSDTKVPSQQSVKAYVDTAVAIYDTGWKDMPLKSGFSSTGVGGSYGAQYRRIGDIVYMRGIVSKTSGNITTSTPPFDTIPAEIRPKTKTVYFDRPCGVTGNMARLSFNTAGVCSIVYVSGSGNYLMLDGINYPL